MKLLQDFHMHFGVLGSAPDILKQNHLGQSQEVWGTFFIPQIIFVVVVY